jgi:hypothetical protein
MLQIFSIKNLFLLGSPMHAKMFEEKITSEVDVPADVIPSIIPVLESE